MKTLPPLQLQLRASRLERAGVVALYLLALPMPWLANLPWWGKAVLSLVLLGLLVHYLQRAWHTEPRVLQLLPDGRWWLSEGETGEEYAQGQGIYCTPWLTVLPLRAEGGRRLRLRLWPDSATTDDLRRLRVWLRWGPGSDEQGGPLATP